MIEEHLAEFVWSRPYEKKGLWDCFVNAIRDIHYDIEQMGSKYLLHGPWLYNATAPFNVSDNISFD